MVLEVHAIVQNILAIAKMSSKATTITAPTICPFENLISEKQKNVAIFE